MAQKNHTPHRWRKRAEELRSLAEIMPTLDRKRLMMEIAESYDVLRSAPRRPRTSLNIHASW
jgi:hypothetical protein